MTTPRNPLQLLSLHEARLAFAGIAVALTLAVACGEDGDVTSVASPTSDAGNADSVMTGTPAPADPALAREAFDDFVDAVQRGDVDTAWNLYVASVPGDGQEHNASLGCDRAAFNTDFLGMQNMFERIAPLSVNEVFGAATGSLSIELVLTGGDGEPYLATLLREPADAPYRVKSFNNGRTAAEPGVPDPLPSPEDPRGYCAIWTGPR